jgi:hypothetical protein
VSWPGQGGDVAHDLTLPDFEQADRIGGSCANPKSRSVGELLIDMEEETSGAGGRLWVVGRWSGSWRLTARVGSSGYLRWRPFSLRDDCESFNFQNDLLGVVNDVLPDDAELASVVPDSLVLVHRHCDEAITPLISAFADDVHETNCRERVRGFAGSSR